jgi:hypothetical protein
VAAGTATPEPIPLLPRRRILGTASGGSTSIRRGGRSDVVSSRPYRPGDHFRTIDWKASARLSSARRDETFIVRERLAEEMPVVVLVVDRRPSLALYPPELPWLHKPDALRAVTALLAASAVNQRSPVGYLDLASHAGESAAGTPFWQRPRGAGDVWRGTTGERLAENLDGPFDAPEDNLTTALSFLASHRLAVPTGSFVFVCSDYLAPLSFDAWAEAVRLGWDVVPVVVQDPVWEQSFPAVEGVLLAVAAPGGSGARQIRLSPGEVEIRRAANEARLRGVLADFLRLGLEPVVLGSSDPGDVRRAFLDWAQARVDFAHGPR